MRGYVPSSLRMSLRHRKSTHSSSFTPFPLVSWRGIYLWIYRPTEVVSLREFSFLIFFLLWQLGPHCLALTNS